jgi:hypothetical protein
MVEISDKEYEEYLTLKKTVSKVKDRRKTCDICGRPNPYHYMLHDEVWKSKGYTYNQLVCLRCSNPRIRDFKELPINALFFYALDLSKTLDAIEKNYELRSKT